MRFTVSLAAVALAVAVAPSVGSAATLSAADRAAIDRTLDVFVPAAIGRVHSERALPLVTASMRVGTTRADWLAGTIPVQPFPVIGKSFHGWTVDTVGHNRADVVLMVHLRRGNDLGLGAASFDLAMRKVGGRWLVDSTSVAATFAPAGVSKVLAQPDFGPGASPHTPQGFAESGRIGAKWILIIAAIMAGVVVLVPIGVLVLHKLGERTRVSEERRERVFRTSKEWTGRG